MSRPSRPHDAPEGGPGKARSPVPRPHLLPRLVQPPQPLLQLPPVAPRRLDALLSLLQEEPRLGLGLHGQPRRRGARRGEAAGGPGPRKGPTSGHRARRGGAAAPAAGAAERGGRGQRGRAGHAPPESPPPRVDPAQPRSSAEPAKFGPSRVPCPARVTSRVPPLSAPRREIPPGSGEGAAGGVAQPARDPARGAGAGRPAADPRHVTAESGRPLAERVRHVERRGPAPFRAEVPNLVPRAPFCPPGSRA